MIDFLSNTQITLLAVSVILMLSSLSFYFSEKHNLSILLLVSTGFTVFCFTATLDPFLNLWDERFHALVAKNMMINPLKPMLYNDPVITMAYDRWDRSIVWLHKQPLFLWQIAICYKLFGVSEFTLRLPGVILLTATVYAIYRSGLLVINRNVGYIGAVLFISSFYIQEIVAGRQQLDVNDTVFTAYVGLSIWSLLEYLNSKNKKWLLVIGVLSGAAILCKWLVGLFVYLIWGIFKILEQKWQPKKQLDIAMSLGLTVLVSLPWQIYTYLKFPNEAAEEMAYNSAHFFTAIEGHDGTWFYHFEIMKSMYGGWILWLIIPALAVFWKFSKQKMQSLALILALVFLYCFFTLAATKMPSFTLIGIPIVVLALASLIVYSFGLLTKKVNSKWVNNTSFLLLTMVLIVVQIEPKSILKTHFNLVGSNEYVEKLSSNKAIFQTLNIPENAILLNVKGRHYIEAMFYTEVPAYNFIPNKTEIQRLLKNGKSLYVFKGNTEISKINEMCPQCTIIEKTVQGWN